MVAVDPAAQRHGIGSSLTEHATAWLREQGMRVAVVDTGGDAGHEPARRVYEQLGFRLFPSAQYFRALSGVTTPSRDESDTVASDCCYRLPAQRGLHCCFAREANVDGRSSSVTWDWHPRR